MHADATESKKTPQSAPQITPQGETPPLIDPFARAITYLRVSVTDRCDFRCVYCMAEHMTFLPKKELLSLEELDRLCSTFVGMGVRKLRVTGGEPLVRKNIMWFFERMARHLGQGLDELTVTTNGSQLRKYAQALADLGVKRINVSLDTLHKAKFQMITRWGRLDQVLDGIEAARAAGLSVKINVVALKGVNDMEVHKIIEWCRDWEMDLTFIEVMPMGDLSNEDRLDQYWSLEDVRTEIARRWTPIDTPEKTGGPARYVRLEETGQKIGFITPLSHNFCESCNRVRLTCTGQLYMCLGQDDDADLRRILRETDDDNRLQAAIREAITRKPKGHDFDYSRQRVDGQVARHMSVTGG
ncbi:MAG: GTP 3',8-cyclase MoaA [Pseudomonadota bacterium]